MWDNVEQRPEPSISTVMDAVGSTAQHGRSAEVANELADLSNHCSALSGCEAGTTTTRRERMW